MVYCARTWRRCANGNPPAEPTSCHVEGARSVLMQVLKKRFGLDGWPSSTASRRRWSKLKEKTLADNLKDFA